MSDQEKIEGQDEDVEAHRRKSKAVIQANEAPEEPGAEGEDDVEAHAMRHRPQSL